MCLNEACYDTLLMVLKVDSEATVVIGIVKISLAIRANI